MKFWIKKENDQNPVDEWADSYVFTINRDIGSTLFSSLPTIWYHMGKLSIDPLYEDLYIIALSIYGLDKRVPRNKFEDCWTRDISVSIPILQIEKWSGTENAWNNMLSFLTGDHWHITFRSTTALCSQHKHKSRKNLKLSNCNCVSLFSGGLDSFCGAIKLLDSGHSPCLVGHNEYHKLRIKQERFATNFRKFYPNQDSQFISFTAGARAPYPFTNNEKLSHTENTSRGRAILFLSFALTIAKIIGEEIPVYIPENGFIGINVALTNSRIGSCSTRTTHPYFIRELRAILLKVGIKNPIENIFAYNSKREIVRMVKDKPAFLSGFKDTISCSHPCQARYNKTGSRKYPINCGYCYPCLIRKASLLDIIDEGDYSHIESPSIFLADFSKSDKSLDLNAVINSIYRFKHDSSEQIRQLIRNTGPLLNEEVDKFEQLYKSGMNDLIELFSKDPRMEKYL